VPKPFPPEFRRDVIAVARRGESTLTPISRDFWISPSCLQRWLEIADRDDGVAAAPGGEPGDAELLVLRRRNKFLEQENEVLRRATAYFARDVVQE